MYKVVDLFAGAGGLSLGFMQTGEFEIVVAVENNQWAQKTYIINHPNTVVLGDISVVDFGKIKNENGNIDVVIGGPPCQGFSNANRQKNHAISLNNRLVKEYIKAVETLQPKSFVLENVDMFRSEIHRFFCEVGEEKSLEDLGITLSNNNVILLPASVKLCNAKEIVENDELLRKYRLKEDIYQIANILFKASKSETKFIKTLDKYKTQISKMCDYLQEFLQLDDSVFSCWSNLHKQLIDCKRSNNISLIYALEEVVLIQRMINTAYELKENNISIYEYDTEEGLSAKVKSYSVSEYFFAVLSNPKNGYTIANGILNAADFGAPQKRNRFFAFGIKQEFTNSNKCELPKGFVKPENYHTVRDAFADLETVQTDFDVNSSPVELDKIDIPIASLLHKLRDSTLLYNNVITSNRSVAIERFKALKQGENFHNLSTDLKENTYTDISRTQNTIYLRLAYDEPSGTVVNVRKSMWIHPVLDRAISVREAARLQTFPDSFIFLGTKDAQYQQVGNAVPPILANAVAEQVLKILK